MSLARKTGTIIIAVIATHAVGSTVVAFATVQPCKPNASGMCMLPKALIDNELEGLEEKVDPAIERKSILVESAKAALRNLASSQALESALIVSSSRSSGLTARLTGQLFVLREQIILKTKEAGLLLQLPGIVRSFMESCGVKKDWQQLCDDYRNFFQGKGIPSRTITPILRAAEES